MLTLSGYKCPFVSQTYCIALLFNFAHWSTLTADTINSPAAQKATGNQHRSIAKNTVLIRSSLLKLWDPKSMLAMLLYKAFLFVPHLLLLAEAQSVDESLSPARGPAERSSSRAIRAPWWLQPLQSSSGVCPGSPHILQPSLQSKGASRNTHSLSLPLFFCSVKAPVCGDFSV